MTYDEIKPRKLTTNWWLIYLQYVDMPQVRDLLIVAVENSALKNLNYWYEFFVLNYASYSKYFFILLYILVCFVSNNKKFNLFFAMFVELF